MLVALLSLPIFWIDSYCIVDSIVINRIKTNWQCICWFSILIMWLAIAWFQMKIFSIKMSFQTRFNRYIAYFVDQFIEKNTNRCSKNIMRYTIFLLIWIKMQILLYQFLHLFSSCSLSHADTEPKWCGRWECGDDLWGGGGPAPESGVGGRPSSAHSAPSLTTHTLWAGQRDTPACPL